MPYYGYMSGEGGSKRERGSQMLNITAGFSVEVVAALGDLAVGDALQVVCIVPNSTGGETVSCSINGAARFVDFDRSDFVALIAQEALRPIALCRFCGSDTTREIAVAAHEGETLTICASCNGQFSETLSREHADALVAPMGSRVPMPGTREYPFDFSGAGWRRHGWARNGVCTQVG